MQTILNNNIHQSTWHNNHFSNVIAVNITLHIFIGYRQFFHSVLVSVRGYRNSGAEFAVHLYNHLYQIELERRLIDVWPRLVNQRRLVP